jgi:sugar phosphate isomerase/epimerase
MPDLSMYAGFHSATIKQGLSFEERSQIAHDAGFHHTAFDISGAMEYDEKHGAGAAADYLKGLELVPDGWGGAPGIMLPADEYKAGLPAFEKLCAYAAGFGHGNVLGLMVFTPNRWPLPVDEAMDRAVHNFSALADTAARHGVVISIEFCGPDLMPDQPHPFVTGVEGAMRIVDAAGKDNLGVLVDSYHLYCAGEEPEAIDRLAKGKVFAAHINDSPPGDHSNFTDAERVMPGDGILPLVDFIKHLDAAGYSGIVPCELFNPDIRRGDPVEVARESRVKSDAIIVEALG